MLYDVVSSGMCCVICVVHDVVLYTMSCCVQCHVVLCTMSCCALNGSLYISHEISQYIMYLKKLKLES